VRLQRTFVRAGNGGRGRARNALPAAEACCARRLDQAPQGSPGLGRAYPKYGASGEGARQRRIKGPLPKGRLGNSAGAQDARNRASPAHRARDAGDEPALVEDNSRVFCFSARDREDRQVLGVPRRPLF
jgi:hypothetical protein